MDNETKDFIKGEIEGLAQMVAKGFEAVDKRFDGVERRLDTVETQVTGMKVNLAQVTKSVVAIDERLTKLEATVDEEKAILLRMENTLSERIHADEDDLQSVRQRVERIEDHVGLSHSLDAA